MDIQRLSDKQIERLLRAHKSPDRVKYIDGEPYLRIFEGETWVVTEGQPPRFKVRISRGSNARPKGRRENTSVPPGDLVRINFGPWLSVKTAKRQIAAAKRKKLSIDYIIRDDSRSIEESFVP